MPFSGSQSLSTTLPDPAPDWSIYQRGVLTLAAAAVGGFAEEAEDAALAVGSGGEVLALLTHTLVHTLAVAVALARCNTRASTHTASLETDG